MAAPNETVWGEIAGSSDSRGGRIGIYATTSNASDGTQTTITVQVWFWSKYGVSDNMGNELYLDCLSSSGSATTTRGGTNIQTTVSTGSGWSTSNQVLLTSKSYTFTKTRGKSDSTYYLYAKLTGVDRVNATMYANTTIDVDALANYTVSYNANGSNVKNVPGDQTKYHGETTFKISPTPPTRNGYSFLGWNTNVDGTGSDYDVSGYYSGNANLLLYAKWEANTYTIKYDANGGNLGEVPTSQTKTHDIPLQLDGDRPTRINYNFLGWSTSKSATTAQYNPGDTYTTEASITLYAVWSLAYIKPRITINKAERCNQAGDPTEDGTCVHLIASWECDNPVVEVTASWYGNNYGVSDVGGEGNTGFVDMVIGDDLISTEYAYDISLYVRDGSDDDHSSTKTATITSYKFHIDCKPGINPGVAVGKVAELDGVFDVGLTSRFLGNRYCMASVGANTNGYVLAAKIDLVLWNPDVPITFVITRRKSATPMTVHIQFNMATSEIEYPYLSTITYEGSNYGAFLVRSNSLEWDLYVQKGSADDVITIQDWYTSKFMDSRITVTFPGTLVTQLPQGLDGWYRATPAVLQSIIDCIMPVGFILTLYNHNDPNTMYPGTTWVRIQNAFLWGCDASGDIGQTGGEKTHTLTVNELPKHSHGSVYSGNASGTKSYAWLASGGSAMAYGAVETGGGAAHNNMPPYVQVSIWRRTA